MHSLTEPQATASLDLLEQLEKLCEKCRFLDAWEAAQPLGPPERWPGLQGLILASRIVHHLGAPRRSDRLDLLAYRRHPSSPGSLARYLRLVLAHRGPFLAQERLRSALPKVSSRDEHGELRALRVQLACELRDFASAEEILEEEAGPEGMSLLEHLARVELLEAQDRHEEAQVQLQRGMEQFPDNYLLAWGHARLLVMLGREQEALEAMEKQFSRLQSYLMAFQLGVFLVEKGYPARAAEVLRSAEKLAPLAEPEILRGLAQQRSEVAYALGDRATAILEARRTELPWMERIAGRMEANPGGRRVLLEVPFVRQHHKTCAPATLTSLGRFWGKEASHVEIAEAICYDGTPAHSERKWATEHGWYAREFTITWASAVALLDAGIPFTMTTVSVLGGHLQAVAGYDQARGTLLVRDPTVPLLREFDADGTFEHFRSTNLRGMALVPEEHRARLACIELPEEALHDHLHRLMSALDEHRRGEAQRHLAALEEAAPQAPLTFRASLSLASYDQDLFALQRAAERHLAQYPDDLFAIFSLLQSKRQLSTRDERVAWLEGQLKEKGHPLFAEELAVEKMADRRQFPEARRLLRGCTVSLQARGRPVALLGELAWQEGELAEAARLLRLASCLEDAEEGIAARAMELARAAGQPLQGLALLRRRKERLGRRSPAAALTFCWALEHTGQPQQALLELEATLAEHPGDGKLLLNAVDWLAAAGQVERSRQLLALAEPLTSRVDWLRAASKDALRGGQPERALALLQEILDLFPLHEGALPESLALRRDLEGGPSVRLHLRALEARFPGHRKVAELRLEALQDGPAEEYEEALRAFLVAHPSSAAAHRELAMLLARQGRTTQAQASLDQAAALENRSAAHLRAVGEVLLASGLSREAYDAFSKALEVSPDDPQILARVFPLLGVGGSSVERLRQLGDLMVRRSLDGVGLHAWSRLARLALPPGEVGPWMLRLVEERGDLGCAWQGRADWLLSQDREDEARAILTHALERFPFHSGLRCLLVDLLTRLGEDARAWEELQQEFERNAGNPGVIRRVCAWHRGQGTPWEALRMLELALARNPGNEDLIRELAILEATLGKQRQAAARIETLLARSPSDETSWRLLAELSEPPERALDFARSCAQAAPRTPALHMAVARLAQEHPDEALAAARKAVELAPREEETNELLLRLLHRAGHTREARAIGDPTRWSGHVPVSIAGALLAIQAQEGDVPGAIPGMKQLLARNIAYLPGWNQLLLWCRSCNDLDGAAEAARQLARLLPEVSSVHEQLGDVLDDGGLREEALRAVLVALELDPTNQSAAHLLSVLVEPPGQDTREAEVALLRMQRAGRQRPIEERAGELSLGLLLAAVTGKEAAARSTFARIASCPRLSGTLLQHGRKRMIEAGFGESAQKVLEGVIQEAQQNPAAASLWLGTMQARGLWRGGALPSPGEHPHALPGALSCALRLEANTGEPGRVRALVQRYEGEILGDERLWLTACDVLCQGSHPLRSVWFTRGLSRYPGVASEAAIHASHVLRALGLRGRAAALNREHAGPERGGNLVHHLWMAYEHALSKKFKKASHHLEALEGASCSDFYEYLRHIILQMKALHESPRSSRLRSLRAIQQDLLANAPSPGSPLLHRLVPVVREEALQVMAESLPLFERALWLTERDSTGWLVLFPVGLLLLVSHFGSQQPLLAWFLGTTLTASWILWRNRKQILAAV